MTLDKSHAPHFPLLISQTSLNNFTPDETSPLNSMNFDELVKDVMISVDENKFMQNPSSSSSSSSPNEINLNRTLSKKLVDEVWTEIVDQENNLNAGDQASSIHQPQDITLEDFLLRAGVISSSNNNHNLVINPRPLMGIDQQPDWMMNMPMQALVDSNFQVPDMGFDNLTVNASPGDSQVDGEKKRWFADEKMEKSIERRERRMIKNRESAARSRARKQAYTNQLEHQEFQLRTTNNWLKKLKEVEMLLDSAPASTPRFQLRRTSSAAF